MATSNLPTPTLLPLASKPLLAVIDDASCCGGGSCCID